jgi:hypothetical protein
MLHILKKNHQLAISLSEKSKERLVFNYLQKVVQEQITAEFEVASIAFFHLIKLNDSNDSLTSDDEMELFSQNYTSKSSKSSTTGSRIFYLTLLLDLQRQAILHHIRKADRNLDDLINCMDRLFPKNEDDQHFQSLPQSLLEAQLQIRNFELEPLIKKLQSDSIEPNGKRKSMGEAPLLSSKFPIYVNNYLMTHNLKDFQQRFLRALVELRKEKDFGITFIEQVRISIENYSNS